MHNNFMDLKCDNDKLKILSNQKKIVPLIEMPLQT
jgi:hypothetical protein